MANIFPSLISADLLNLKHEIEEIDPYVGGYHIDVADFHFVPNLTWGPAFINAIRLATYKPLWVHLMVEYPEKYFDRLALQEEDIVSFHAESKSTYSMQSLTMLIKSNNWIPSIALNPTTPLSILIPLKDLLEHVLIMSVEPGFSGQSFIPSVQEKIQCLVEWRKEHQLSFTIAVDGGIDASNFSNLVNLGATQLAVASAIFSHTNRLAAIKDIVKNH